MRALKALGEFVLVLAGCLVAATVGTLIGFLIVRAFGISP